MSMSPSVAMLVSPRPREHYKHILPVVNPPVKQDRPWGQILELAVPNVAANLIMYSTAVVTTLCISSLDQPDLLASFGLGNLIGNVLGLSIGVGLTSVLETLVSQSYGAGNVRLASIHLNRARIVVTAALFPCAICLWYTDQLLLWLGQDPTVCALAATFTRATIPGLLPFFYNCCTSSYLRSCQHPRPPLIANIIGSISHVFVCIYLVNTLGLGMLGAGLATTINNILRFVILEVFLSWKSSELHGHSWDPETLSWKGIHHFLGLGLPSFALVFSEWAAFELNSVIAGWVSTEGLAAHVAGINILAIVYMFPYGVSQSLSTLIGASLGEGLPKLAIEFTNKGRWLMFGIACIYGSLIYIYRDGIARIYSTDETMLEILTSLLTLCGGFVIFDAMNTTQAGIIRGLGLQTRAAKYQTFAMFGVMLPFGYIFYHQLGVNAVWWGAMLGMTTSATLFYSLIYHCDYYECSRRAISESGMNRLLSVNI